jgi:hypothetical protein
MCDQVMWEGAKRRAQNADYECPLCKTIFHGFASIPIGSTIRKHELGFPIYTLGITLIKCANCMKQQTNKKGTK